MREEEDDRDGDEAPSAPLIIDHGNASHGNRPRPSEGAPPLEDAGVDESELKAPNGFLWALTFCAGISGLLFGYDTGIISSTLILLTFPNRPITTLDKSLITASTSLLALVASPFTGYFADAWGRKKVLVAADTLFVIGALLQAFSSNVGGMILGRSIIGVAVGSASSVVPLYISELSPTPFRGRLVTISALLITGGQVVAYCIGYLLSPHISGWRWMVGLGTVPAVLQLVMLCFMPDTPRWLMKAAKREDAKIVLEKVFKGCQSAKRIAAGVLRRIEREIAEEESVSCQIYDELVSKPTSSPRLWRTSQSFTDLVRIGGNRRALVIACMLQAFQQLCGFNTLMYFSATIFSLVGFTSPTLTSLSIAITNFTFTLVAFYAIDRIGRRRILLWSIPIMIAGLVLCAIAFHFIGSLGSKDASANQLAEQSMIWPYLLLTALVLYVSSYAVGLGNIPWQQSELFPLNVRALGAGLATSINWASNFVVGLTFLPLMQHIGGTWTFGLYAIVCVMGYIAVWRIYPETSGLSLEEVGSLLAAGWGVSKVEQEAARRI